MGLIKVRILLSATRLATAHPPPPSAHARPAESGPVVFKDALYASARLRSASGWLRSRMRTASMRFSRTDSTLIE